MATVESVVTPAAGSAGDDRKNKNYNEVAEGIRQHKVTKRFRVRWTDRGRRKEKRFPPDTAIGFMVAYKKRKEGVAASAEKKTAATVGSFIRDVARFLRTRKHMESYKAERSHLKAWLKVHQGSRFALTEEKVTRILSDWQSAAKKHPQGTPSAKTIKHRLNALQQFFKFHDGKSYVSVAHTAERPKVKHTIRKPIPGGDALIAKVAANLEQQELKGRLRDGKTRARFAVLASCGKRPCQVMRARPEDVELDNRVWWVDAAKNSNGGPLWLNDDMVAAWTLFINANAWGKYDCNSFADVLYRNGWPKGIEPYAMRHETLQRIEQTDIDHRRLQQASGHTRLETTQRHYTHHTIRGSKVASEAIEGRFPDTMFRPRKEQKYDNPPQEK